MAAIQSVGVIRQAPANMKSGYLERDEPKAVQAVPEGPVTFSTSAGSVWRISAIHS